MSSFSIENDLLYQYMKKWEFVKKPEFWVNTIVSAILGLIGGFAACKYGIFVNNGTVIEGGFTQDHSVSSFGGGRVEINGRVEIGKEKCGSGVPC